MLQKFLKQWNEDKLNLRLFIFFSVISILWVVVLFFIGGFISGFGSMVLIAALFIYSGITFKEPRYYIFTGVVFVIFLYDLLLLVNNSVSLAVTIGLIAIYVLIMALSTIIMALHILEIKRTCFGQAIIAPLNFIIVGFYTILCAEMTDVYISYDEFQYTTTLYFPIVLFGLYFLQLGFMFYSRWYHLRCTNECPRRLRITEFLQVTTEHSSK